jgi:tetratricopeptide (TPR) repeat protein
MSGFPAAITRGFLAWGLAELGEFDEALTWAQEGTQIASEVNSAMTAVWVTNYLALTHLLRGEIGRAIALLEPNLELCQRAEVRLLLTLTSGILGFAFSAAGRKTDAVPLLEMAVRPENLRYHPQGSGYPLVWLADGYLHASRFEEAGVAVVKALDTAQRQEERGHEAWARFTQARIEQASGAPLHTVASRFRSALELAESCEMRPLAALCRFHLGTAQLEFAQPIAARTLLEEARNEFRIMGMASWLGQADQLLGVQ